MCTSIATNINTPLMGFNLDILDMEYKVVVETDKVYIAIYDDKEGWLPLFGANANGSFVTMPTCWPYDDRSDPKAENAINIIKLNSDLLLGKKTFAETKEIVENNSIYSVPNVTFQAQLSDNDGNVLQVIPGQGYKFYTKPHHMVMTNFSPFKYDREQHPWMGLDRYHVVEDMLNKASDEFTITELFDILKVASQTICPTVVSMVFDLVNKTVYWCEGQEWGNIHKQTISII